MIIQCVKCGQYSEKPTTEKMWIMRRVNSTIIEHLDLCETCRNKLIDFVRNDEKGDE